MQRRSRSMAPPKHDMITVHAGRSQKPAVATKITIYGPRGSKSVVQQAPSSRRRTSESQQPRRPIPSDKSDAWEPEEVEDGAAPSTTFLEKDPKPVKPPIHKRQPVRVLVAASGYIDLATAASGSGSRSQAARARMATLTSADAESPEVIKCSDSFVQLHTTYTDAKRFVFHRVYGSTSPNDSMFTEVLPIVMDAANGINGHIIVSGQAGGFVPARVSCISPAGSCTSDGFAFCILFILRRRTASPPRGSRTAWKAARTSQQVNPSAFCRAR